MLDLAISIDTDARGTSVIETNGGKKLKAPRWPQDCEFQLVAFNPSGKVGDVITTEELAEDMSCALRTLQESGLMIGTKPDWYKRLAYYARGASSNGGMQ
jgi:hypothetical protein